MVNFVDFVDGHPVKRFGFFSLYITKLKAFVGSIYLGNHPQNPQKPACIGRNTVWRCFTGFWRGSARLPERFPHPGTPIQANRQVCQLWRNDKQKHIIGEYCGWPFWRCTETASSHPRHRQHLKRGGGYLQNGDVQTYVGKR